MKTCNTCGKEKPPEGYYDRKDKLGRLSKNNKCKACMREASKKWKAANPEKQHEHVIKHREKQKAAKEEKAAYEG